MLAIKPKHSVGSETGISIPIVLWTVMIIIGLSVVAAQAATTSEHSAQRTRGSENALQAADAGIQLTLYRLNQTQPPFGRCPNHVGEVLDNSVTASGSGPRLWCPVDEVDTGGEAGSFARVRVSGGEVIAGSGQPLAQGCQSLQTRTIVSTGLAGGAGGTKVVRTLKATVTTLLGESKFPFCGLMADEVQIANKSRVYSSAGVNTQLKLSQHGKLFGSMYYDVENKPVWTADELPTYADRAATDPAFMYETSVASQHVDLAPLYEPLPPLDSTLNWQAKASNASGVSVFGTKLNTSGCVLNNNNYNYSWSTRELTLRGGTATNPNCAARLLLDVNGPTRNFRFCTLKILDGARLVIPEIKTGPPVRIWIEDEYGTGDEDCPDTLTAAERFRLGQEGRIENHNDPSRVIIYGEGERYKDDGVTPNTTLYRMCVCGWHKNENASTVKKTNEDQEFVMVAPHWEVRFANYGALRGGAAAGKVYLTDRSRFSYAEELSGSLDNEEAGSLYAFRSNSWTECRPVSVDSTDFTDSTCQ